MVLKKMYAVMMCAALTAWNSAARSDAYRPDEFLRLDLSAAVLSPKPLGPASGFVPAAVDAKAPEAKAPQVKAPEATAPQAGATPASENPPAPTAHVAHPKTRVAHTRSPTPHMRTQTRVARRHGNPLDAQASDTRI